MGEEGNVLLYRGAQLRSGIDGSTIQRFIASTMTTS
jgi:hypothetical protein